MQQRFVIAFNQIWMQKIKVLSTARPTNFATSLLKKVRNKPTNNVFKPVELLLLKVCVIKTMAVEATLIAASSTQ